MSPARRLPGAVLAALLSTAAVPAAAAPGSPGEGDPVVRWNREVLAAVRRSTMPPPAVARALAVVNTCIYDAWAAYDGRAVPTRPTGARRPAADRIPANRVAAVSAAAHLAATDLFPTERAAFDQALRAQGLGPASVATEPGSPAQVGRAACRAVLDFRHRDGANQLGDMPGSSGAPYSDYTNYRPVNDPDTLRDPNRWQPLRITSAAGETMVQRFALPHWPRVRPFALRSASQLRSASPPARYGSSRYAQQADALVILSANLSDETKAVAEYWGDGPGTETPPGHWALIATFCSERDGMTLDENVVMFFALANAVFDAGIVAWDNKLAFDYVRPVSAIRHLYGGRPIAAWGGPGQGTRTIDGSTWQPYLATPPFAEYTSGHSTFSAAAAEILRLLTGSDRFGGSAIVGAGTSRVEPGVSPTRDVELAWPTFSEAAAQAGMSRQYAGIHFAQADADGQEAGRAVARLVWARVQAYVNGVR